MKYALLTALFAYIVYSQRVENEHLQQQIKAMSYENMFLSSKLKELPDSLRGEMRNMRRMGFKVSNSIFWNQM